MILLTLLLLSQTPTAVNISDPTTQSKKVTTTTGAGKVALDINCVSGCSGAGGGSGSSLVWVDGGRLVADEGVGPDGGVWPVYVVNSAASSAPSYVNAVIDGGFVNVGIVSSVNTQAIGFDGGFVSVANFPASQAVTGTFFQSTQPVSIASMPSTPVTGPLTDTQLRATPVPTSLASTTITGSVAVTGPLTDAQLRATQVPVGVVFDGGFVSVTNFPASQAVTGTFFQAVQPVSVVFDGGFVSVLGSVAVTGPLTDVQLRASQVPVGIVFDGGFVSVLGSVAVTGPLTDTQLRASQVPVGVVFDGGFVSLLGSVAVNQNLSRDGGTDWPVIAKISDAQGGIADVFPAGSLRVQTEPKQVFLDTFDFGVDTVNMWMSPVAAGGGVLAVLTSQGAVPLGTGTTANGFSYIQSIPRFRASTPGFLQVYHAVNLEFPVTANTFRFWGLGSVPLTPTAAAPLTDAVGFEVATTGKMFAVAYSGGVRTAIGDLSTSTGNSAQPQDASVHKYYFFFRGDLAYWCIDTTENVVATMSTGAPGPIVNTLPLILLAVAGSTPPISSGTLTDNAAFIGDTSGARGNTLVDGVYPFRQAQIVPAGTIPSTSSGTALVVTSRENAPNAPKEANGNLDAIRLLLEAILTESKLQTLTIQGLRETGSTTPLNGN